MRSVFTDGVLDCLMDHDIYFSDIYGISAASKDMVYYALKKKNEAFKLNLLTARDENVINLGNIIFGQSAFNSEYFFNVLQKNNYPIDYNSLKDLDINLYFGTTNFNLGKIEYFTNKDSNIKDSILASCSIPVIQKPVIINNNEYIDGGVCENIPFQTAIKNGFNKIVCISTREKGYRKTKESASKENMFINMKYGNDLNKLKLLTSVSDRYNEEFSKLDSLTDENKIFTIYLSKPCNVEHFEKDINKLEELYKDGYNQMEKNLEKLYKYLM